MRVDFNFSISANNIAFTSKRAQKLINKVKSAEKIEKVHISFDELKLMYKEIGYEVVYKRGSHAVVPVTEDFNIPVVIPHKRKTVLPFDLKRFLYVMSGEFDKAKNC